MGESTVLWILILFIVREALSQCPPVVNNLCKCSVSSIGLDVNCSAVDLAAIANALVTVKGSVASLEMSDVNVPTLKAKSFSSLNIRKLSLNNAHIFTVDKDAFDGLSGLDSLILSNNNISEFPNLAGLQKLRFLDLSGNSIVDIPDGQFVDNEELNNLMLGRNKICSLGRNALNETKFSLQLLDLSNNCLTKVPAQNLRGFQKLAVVDLGWNEITDMPNLQFMNLPTLREVHLEGNKISQVWPLAFVNVPSLQSLYLQDNLMSVLEPNKFQSLEALEVVNMSGNRIQKVPSSAFQNLPALKQVLLDSNFIDSIDTMAFSNDPRLQLISLQNNRIPALSRNAFDQLPQMQILLLTNNSLSSVDAAMLSGLSALQQLNLRGNQLVNISEGAFNVVPQLTTLDLSYNKLEVLPPALFAALKKLFWLDMSSNNIATLPENIFPPRVANIGLQDNPLDCSESSMWLVHYLVDNNVRSFLPGAKDITCKTPPSVAGKKLKDLMIQRANETFFKGLNDVGSLLGGGVFPSSGGGFPNLLGSLISGGGIGLGGLDLGKVLSAGGGANLLSSMAGVASPLAKLAASVPPNGFVADKSAVTADVNSLLGAIPPLMKDMRDYNRTAQQAAIQNTFLQGIDLSKIPPSIIQHVLAGGTIPGISPAMMQSLIQQYLSQLQPAPNADPVIAGAQPRNPYVPGFTLPNGTLASNLPPLSSIPKDVMQAVINGQKLGSFNEETQEALKQHYLKEYVVTAAQPVAGRAMPPLVMDGLDLSKIPPDVMKDLAAGKTPDVTKVPVAVLRAMEANPYLLAQIQRVLRGTKVDADGIPILSPTMAAEVTGPSSTAIVELKTLSPEATIVSVPGARSITIVLLSLVGFLTCLTVTYLCFQHYRRRQREEADKRHFLDGGGGPFAVSQSNENIASAAATAAAPNMRFAQVQRNYSGSAIQPWTVQHSNSYNDSSSWSRSRSSAYLQQQTSS